MYKILGIKEKLTPIQCYEYWYSRILPSDIEYVTNSVDRMIKGRSSVQLKYRWIHPTYGEVYVRCSGIRTQDVGRMITLEGYHRILTGVEGS